MFDDPKNHYTFVEEEDGKLVVICDEDQKRYDLDNVKSLPPKVRQEYISKSIDSCSKRFYKECCK